MVSLERILPFVMLTVILASLFVPALDSAISESGKNENLQDSREQYETRAHLGVSDAQMGFSGSSTPPIVQWNGTYGGTDYEYASALAQTTDGGYALAGSKPVSGYYDAWLVKTDACGNVKWNKTFGGKWSEGFGSIVQTHDGGFAMAGSSNSYSAYPYRSDCYLVKTDWLGNLQWNKTYGGEGEEGARSMVQTSDGGYALAGLTSPGVGDSQIYFVKTDSNGEMQWNKTYRGVDSNQVYSVVQTSDGGYALTGYSYIHSLDKPEVFLIKIDSVGEITWSWWYEGVGRCVAHSLVQIEDGGYALAGINFTYGTGYYGDAYLVKTDSFGNVQWSKTYGWAGSEEIAYSLVQATDGGYALAGRTYPLSGGSQGEQLYVVKTDSDGDMQWNITYGGTDDDSAHALVQTADGGYATAGCARSFGAGGDDFWLVKFSAPDDLYVASIEPIQVVLDAKALVANKSTAIRATISSTFESRVWVEINVTYDFGRKWYLEDGPNDLGIPIDPGLNRVYIPGGPVKPTACPSPWEWQDQLLWTSSGFDSNIKAVVDPLDKILEVDETNNEAIAGMNIIESESLRIRVVPICFPFQKPFSPDLDDARDFLLATYPIAEDKFTWSEVPLRQIVLPPEMLETPEAFTAAIYPLFVRQIAHEQKRLGYDRIVFVFKAPLSWDIVRPIAFGDSVAIPYPLGLETDIAHEIGHTYGLWHPHDLGPPVYDAVQFWVKKRDYERPGSTFMSYITKLPPGVPALPQWIDKGRYDTDRKERTELLGMIPWSYRWNLLDQFTVTPHLLAANDEVIMLQGLIFKNGTVLDEPWYHMSGKSSDILPGTSGNFSIVCLDSSRQVLSQMGFNASFTMLVDDPNGTLVEMGIDFVPLDFNIPSIAGTRFIEIRNQTEHVLYERTVSENAPVVTVSNPNGGEALSGGVNYTITWHADDLDGDPLLYSVAYSPDGGENWVSLASEITTNSFVWDTHGLPSGSNYLIRIVATDGVNTGEDFSDNIFTVLDLDPPTIIVDSPQNRNYFSNLVPLTFETNEQTSWVGYSIDNQMNITISSNTIMSVADGTHQMTLYANDTSGNMGASSAVHFTVNSSFYDPWKTSFIAQGGYPTVDFATHNGELYAAADRVLYEYDGSSWRVINAPAYITSIISFNGRLIIGCQGGLYCYSGVGFTLIFQVPTYVRMLGVYNNTLYAGSLLDRPPILYYCSGSVENSGNWHIDTGFSAILNFSGPFGSIDSFGEYNGNVYVTSGGTIYCYDGTGWSTVKTYVDVYGFSSMKVYDGNLYLATRDQGWRKPMYLGGSGFSGRVIEFDGENWTTVFDHDYWIYSLETYDSKLYAGTADKILIYNGTEWSTSFNALEGAYYAISFTVFDGKIYVGMGNGYIFADPAGETAVPSESLPSTTIPEFPPTTFMAFFIILSLPLVFFVKRRSCKRFAISSRNATMLGTSISSFCRS